MKRENRYLTFKLSDLSEEQKRVLALWKNTTDYQRLRNGKSPLVGVFVEQDWPEYHIVWGMIEARVDGINADKTDWCPVCKQGWDCSFRDQESRIQVDQLTNDLVSTKINAEFWRNNCDMANEKANDLQNKIKIMEAEIADLRATKAYFLSK